MKNIGAISLTFMLLLSCKKDKVPEPCTGVSMSGDRERFVGTWRWDSTLVEEWFDVGSSIYFYYTPETEGFEYYFTISQSGEYMGYKNNALIHKFLMSKPISEVYSNQTVNAISVTKDCSSEEFDVRQFGSNITNDSIYQFAYPLNFDDQANHLRSVRNYFVRE